MTEAIEAPVVTADQALRIAQADAARAYRDLSVYRIQLALERAGFATEHIEGLAPDDARTLEHWAANLDARHEEALALAGAERLRVWRLYLRAARNGFRSGFTSAYQVRCEGPASVAVYS